MKKIVFALAILLAWNSVSAQKRNFRKKTSYDSKNEISSVGLGAGLDYGGFGARYTYFASQHIGIFGSGGYAIAGFGYNVGAVARLLSKTRITPTLSAMYGYNGAIHVENIPGPVMAQTFNKLYYGPSIGIGLVRKLRSGWGYWHTELIIPFRSSEYERDRSYIKSIPNMNLKSDPGPVVFSFGLNFTIKK